MTIYGNLKSIPELSQLSSKERRLIWWRVAPRTYLHWQTWLGLTVCGACAYIGCRLGFAFGHPMLGAAIGGGLGGVIFSQASIYVARRHYKDILLKNNR
jgi:hypothetical protein